MQHKGSAGNAVGGGGGVLDGEGRGRSAGGHVIRASKASKAVFRGRYKEGSGGNPSWRTSTCILGGDLKRNARAVRVVQLFGRLAVVETHTLWYYGDHCCLVVGFDALGIWHFWMFTLFHPFLLFCTLFLPISTTSTLFLS